MTTNQTPVTPANDIAPAQTLPVHSFRLRPDCTLQLQLPDDLTRREVKRLHLFLKSVVGIDGSAHAIDADWPYAVANEDEDFDLQETDELFADDEDLIVDEDFLTDMEDDKTVQPDRS